MKMKYNSKVSEKYWHQQLIFREQKRASFVIGVDFSLVINLHHMLHHILLLHVGTLNYLAGSLCICPPVQEYNMVKCKKK